MPVVGCCLEPTVAGERLAGMKHAGMAAAVGLLLMLAACRGAGSGTTTSLDGTWILTSGTSAGAPIPLVPGRDITLVIDGNTASGRACNLISGTIAVSGSAVKLTNLAMTEMACDGPIMTTEAAYFAALGAVDSASRRGDSLTLGGPQVTLRYALEPPVADTPLIGTPWALETVIDGDVASSTVGGRAMLLLEPDGTATGSTGCAGFTARYRLDGDRLTLYDLSVQTVLCTVDLQPQDRLVREVLSNGAAAAVRGATLTLTGRDGRGLGYRVAGGSSSAPGASPTIANPDPIEPSLPGDKPLPLEPPISDGGNALYAWSLVP
jgi:heat shock protein HslJ